MIAHEPGPRCGRESSKAEFRTKLTIQHGYKLAEEAGRDQPSLKDAIWELLMEAADTLKRLPNRERGWLTATSRAHWPEVVRDFDTGGSRSRVVRLRRAPASAEAIDRMDEVLQWLVHAGGAKPQRDVGVLFGLACGLKVMSLKQRYGCGRRTVYDIRDRSLLRLCKWLSGDVGKRRY
ncbi:hypothetical protein HBA54_16625 [Pelagibius litoralis]|uniref:DUF6362 domain-containing protein n=1 Tax=Pelagibius litoralis TaxID=374515 RepID=A0A967EZB3_9PROT|nr:DUF6362 family protein [Pelagibius litoralis]NIA70233.1 hypothetical protein [Pelagibius litoralis]